MVQQMQLLVTKPDYLSLIYRVHSLTVTLACICVPYLTCTCTSRQATEYTHIIHFLKHFNCSPLRVWTYIENYDLVHHPQRAATGTNRDVLKGLMHTRVFEDLISKEKVK